MSDIDNDNDNGVAVMLEDIQSQLATILEGQVPQATVPTHLESIDHRLDTIEVDVKVIKAAVTDQSSQLKDHGLRIASLEPVA